jgi:carboxymethylenebutenolidase
MSERVLLKAGDGHVLSAWSSSPEGACKGGVVVLHAVFGLTSHIGDVCDRWAAAGFRALAPALYDRLGPGVVHPYGRAGAEAGSRTYARLTDEQILADIAACARDLSPHGPVAITGFCTGGSWSWTAASRMSFAAQVAFYGSHIHERLEQAPLCPTQLHYGADDHVVSEMEQQRIRAAFPALDMRLYEGAGHAFMNPEQEFFNEPAAQDAWTSAIAFIEASFAAAKA